MHSTTIQLLGAHSIVYREVKPECSDSKQRVHTDGTSKRLEQRYQRNRLNPISEGSVRISNSNAFNTPYAAVRKLGGPSWNPETKIFNRSCNALLFIFSHYLCFVKFIVYAFRKLAKYDLLYGCCVSFFFFLFFFNFYLLVYHFNLTEI